MSTDGSGFNRRHFMASTANSAISLLVANEVAAQMGNKSSGSFGRAIREIQVGAPTSIPNNAGDTWVAAWGDDGNLYTPSNDTGGFHGNELVFRVLPELTAEQKKRIESDDAKIWGELSQEQKGRLERDGPGGPIAFNRVFGTDPLALDGATVNWMRDFSRQGHGKVDGCRAWRPRPPSTFSIRRGPIAGAQSLQADLHRRKYVAPASLTFKYSH
jgi:hypothetical protein